MNKYEFKFISTDNYELEYTDKEGNEKVIPFTRTVEMAQKMQGIQANARLKMYQELTKQGITKDDLIIRKKNADGTTIYDETNFKMYEEEYIQTQSAITLNEIIEKCFKMNITDLLIDMGVDPNTTNQLVVEKVKIFSSKLSSIIIGNENKETPSGSNKEENK